MVFSEQRARKRKVNLAKQDPGREVKQEQEEISPNPVRAFSGASVCTRAPTPPSVQELHFRSSCMNMNVSMVNGGGFSVVSERGPTHSGFCLCRARAPRDWGGRRRKKPFHTRARCDVDVMARDKMVKLIDRWTAAFSTSENVFFSLPKLNRQILILNN